MRTLRARAKDPGGVSPLGPPTLTVHRSVRRRGRSARRSPRRGADVDRRCPSGLTSSSAVATAGLGRRRSRRVAPDDHPVRRPAPAGSGSARRRTSWTSWPRSCGVSAPSTAQRRPGARVVAGRAAATSTSASAGRARRPTVWNTTPSRPAPRSSSAGGTAATGARSVTVDDQRCAGQDRSHRRRPPAAARRTRRATAPVSTRASGVPAGTAAAARTWSALTSERR